MTADTLSNTRPQATTGHGAAMSPPGSCMFNTCEVNSLSCDNQVNGLCCENQMNSLSCGSQVNSLRCENQMDTSVDHVITQQGFGSACTNCNDEDISKGPRRRRRKRLLTGVSRQRRAANARERMRVQAMNMAFIQLRSILPILDAPMNEVSKYDTLRVAAKWIAHLTSLLLRDDQRHLGSLMGSNQGSPQRSCERSSERSRTPLKLPRDGSSCKTSLRLRKECSKRSCKGSRSRSTHVQSASVTLGERLEQMLSFEIEDFVLVELGTNRAVHSTESSRCGTFPSRGASPCEAKTLRSGNSMGGQSRCPRLQHQWCDSEDSNPSCPSSPASSLISSISPSSSPCSAESIQRPLTDSSANPVPLCTHQPSSPVSTYSNPVWRPHEQTLSHMPLTDILADVDLQTELQDWPAAADMDFTFCGLDSLIISESMTSLTPIQPPMTYVL